MEFINNSYTCYMTDIRDRTWWQSGNSPSTCWDSQLPPTSPSNSTAYWKVLWPR